MLPRKYKFSGLWSIEEIQLYQPGGFHPVSIGDIYANGRYKILHKLGYGGESTVWLARDLRPQPGDSDTLVALKVLSGFSSTKPTDEIPDLFVPDKLDMLANATHNPAGQNFLAVKDYFTVEGPNGKHVCIVTQFVGASVLSMGSRGCGRLRGDLARKVAKQTADMVELMHSAGLVHGDLTSSNILFQVSPRVRRWTDEEVYSTLGRLWTEEIETLDNSPPGPHAPRELVQPIDNHDISSPSFLEENIVVTDFGQSYDITALPKDYTPGTALHYFSPEARFDNIITPASDIWGLACTIFEIRAGFSLFNSVFTARSLDLQNIVRTLGKLPEPWWSKFEKRHVWFEENGEPKVQVNGEPMFPARKTSIRKRLQTIGDDEKVGSERHGPMMDPPGTRLEEEEIELLSNLLEKMLRYQPENRITIKEVVRHPWFEYTPRAGTRSDSCEIA
ncbi:kinase-like domain-containing protein [Amanita rubescens]|nr:kinase-like domain-containing protein [Amanita rubescens]